MIYIDASAFVARERGDDTWHKEAVQAWNQIRRSRPPCITSSLVVSEALQVIARYAGYAYSAAFGRDLLSSEIVILRSTIDDERQAIDLMEKYEDQKIGFADCISFVLMRRNRLKTVFSFDRHFEVPGFRLWPGAGRF